MKVIDNFLPKDSFLDIKTILESNNFPWFFQNTVSGKDNDYYFIHHLYNHDTISSNYFNMIKPIIDKIKIKSLIRIKCNVYPSTQKAQKHPTHKDYDFKHLGAIYYVNSNNGYTSINKNKIESIENRFLLFDPSVEHNSVTCTDEKVRLNINFNYF